MNSEYITLQNIENTMNDYSYKYNTCISKSIEDFMNKKDSDFSRLSSHCEKYKSDLDLIITDYNKATLSIKSIN